MHYWGGAAPGTYKCACGLTEEGCVGNSKTCNCDSGQDTSDDGLLMHKDYLPVLELHFGDTGTSVDNSVGYFELGNLECDGDSMYCVHSFVKAFVSKVKLYTKGFSYWLDMVILNICVYSIQYLTGTKRFIICVFQTYWTM